MPVRALKTGAWVALAGTMALAVTRQTSWLWGFALGSLLSLGSLFSLAVLVPFLLRPETSKNGRFLLGMTLFMKLPLYCVGLYAGTRIPGGEPMALGLGLCIVPIVMTFKAAADMLEEGRREAREAEERARARAARRFQAQAPSVVAPQAASQPAARVSTSHPHHPTVKRSALALHPVHAEA